jgi:hypothetical protein
LKGCVKDNWLLGAVRKHSIKIVKETNKKSLQHFRQNSIDVEARTREAAMIDALGKIVTILAKLFMTKWFTVIINSAPY